MFAKVPYIQSFHHSALCSHLQVPLVGTLMVRGSSYCKWTPPKIVQPTLIIKCIKYLLSLCFHFREWRMIFKFAFWWMGAACISLRVFQWRNDNERCVELEMCYKQWPLLAFKIHAWRCTVKEGTWGHLKETFALWLLSLKQKRKWNSGKFILKMHLINVWRIKRKNTLRHKFKDLEEAYILQSIML